MPTIQEIRSQYPQYGDLSDGQLADALHQKFYADMPRDQFDAKIGLSQPSGGGFMQRVGELGRGAARGFGSVMALPKAPEGQPYGFPANLLPEQTGDIPNAISPPPSDRTGRYIGTIGEFVGNPVSMMGGAAGSIARNIASKAVPAITGALGSETAGQGAEAVGFGETGQKAARFVGGVTGGAIGGRVASPPSKAPPGVTNEQVKNAGASGFDELRGMQVKLDPPSVGGVSQGVKQTLENKDFDEILSPLTFKTLQKLEKVRPPPGPHPIGETPPTGDMTLGQVLSVRSKLGMLARERDINGDFTREATAAQIAKNELSKYLDTLANTNIHHVISGDVSELSPVLKEANANWSAYERASLIDQKRKVAENQTAATGYGGNIENKLRQSIEHIVDNPELASSFPPWEIEEMQAYIRGDLKRNMSRQTGKALAPGGSVSSIPVLVTLLKAGLEPAAAVATLGYSAKIFADRAARQGIGKLSENIRESSPFAQAQAYGQPPPSASGSLPGAIRAADPSAQSGPLTPDDQQIPPNAQANEGPIPPEIAAMMPSGHKEGWGDVALPALRSGLEAAIFPPAAAYKALAATPEMAKRAFEQSERVRAGFDFDPGPVVQAAMMALSPGGGAVPKGSAGIFGGKLWADKAKLAQATQMEKVGKPPTEIWRETGMFRDTDGQWSFEIPDDKMTVAYGKGKGVAGEGSRIQHEELNKYDPKRLGRVPHKITEQQVGSGEMRPHWGTNPPEISVSGPGAEGAIWPEFVDESGRAPGGTAKNVTAHELQHVVDDLLGRNAGTSPEAMQSRAYRELWKESPPRLEPKELRRYEELKQKGDLSVPESEEFITLSSKKTDIPAEMIRHRAYDLYYRNKSEVRARNAAHRADWSPEQRAANPPFMTEDVPRNRQIDIDQALMPGAARSKEPPIEDALADMRKENAGLTREQRRERDRKKQQEEFNKVQEMTDEEFEASLDAIRDALKPGSARSQSKQANDNAISADALARRMQEAIAKNPKSKEPFLRPLDKARLEAAQKRSDQSATERSYRMGSNPTREQFDAEIAKILGFDPKKK